MTGSNIWPLIATLATALVGVHGLVAAYIHIFTEFNWVTNNPPEFLWALAVFGNRQAFIAIIDLAVAFDLFAARHLMTPLLGLHVLMTAFNVVSTQINGRHLHLIAPSTPGLTAPFVLSALCALGIFANSGKSKGVEKKL